MVLYVFSIRDTGWLKMGYTSHCPWSRARDGYWKNLHPELTDTVEPIWFNCRGDA